MQTRLHIDEAGLISIEVDRKVITPFSIPIITILITINLYLYDCLFNEIQSSNHKYYNLSVYSLTLLGLIEILTTTAIIIPITVSIIRMNEYESAPTTVVL